MQCSSYYEHFTNVAAEVIHIQARLQAPNQPFLAPALTASRSTLLKVLPGPLYLILSKLELPGYSEISIFLHRLLQTFCSGKGSQQLGDSVPLEIWAQNFTDTLTGFTRDMQLVTFPNLNLGLM